MAHHAAGMANNGTELLMPAGTTDARRPKTKTIMDQLKATLTADSGNSALKQR